MMDHWSRLGELMKDADGVTRRAFLKRSVIMGASVPAVASLLAACGGEEDEEPEEAEAEPTQARSVPTTNIGGAATEEATTEATTEVSGTATSITETTATAEAAGTEETTKDVPKQGGVLVGLGHHEIASLSPDDWGPSVHYFIVGNIHGRVMKLDPWFNLNPSLARSFEVSDDGLMYTFNLHEGVKFHDGEDFTSEDVKYTYDFRRDPANAAVIANDFAAVGSIDTPDDYTVVVNLTRPDASFLTYAGQAGIVPQHYHSEIGEDQYKAAPVGTGPFKLVEWRAAEFTELEAFEDYFEGRPHLDGIRENIVPEASVRAVALRTGDADTSVWALVTEDNIAFRDDPQFTTFVTSSLAVNHFPINNEHPFISDKAARQAMMFAIDRDRLVNDLWQGLAVKATANLSPALQFYYEPDVKQYPYDPAQAMALLDEAGWVDADGDGIRERDGVKAQFTCTVIAGDQARRPEAEVVQQDLKAVGIDMQIAEAPLATIQEGQRNGTIDASLYNWTYGGGSGEPDASTTLKSDARNNWSHFKNQRVDELLEQGVTELDPEQRKVIYSEIQKIVAEEVPFLYIMYWDWFTIFSPRVQGLPEAPLTADAIYQFAHTYWIQEE